MDLGDGVEVDELEEVIIWLDQLPLSKQKKNLTKDFSDGVLMSEVLKIYFPKLVELHNYIKTSSTSVKVDNWNVLNRKVLKKLNLKLSTSEIHQLANSVPGTIHRLLLSVRRKVVECQEEVKLPSYLIDDDKSGSSTEIMIVPVTHDEDGQVLKYQRMVPFQAYENKKKKLAQKEEEVTALLERVTYLESMVQFKNQRINDISTQLIRYQNESKVLSSLVRDYLQK